MKDILAETDFVLGLIFKDDSLHKHAENAYKLFRIYLSPYTSIEINLLFISGKVKVEKPIDFLLLIDKVLSALDIQILMVDFKIHALSYKIRRKYKLSLFDSLHAATAISYDFPILSSDKIYGEIKEVNWINLKNI